jgi:hypothetical protein
VYLLGGTNGSDHASAHGLMIVGLFLLVGFAAHVLGHRTHVPRVTILLLLGFLAGPAVFHPIPAAAAEWFPLAAGPGRLFLKQRRPESCWNSFERVWWPG